MKVLWPSVKVHEVQKRPEDKGPWLLKQKTIRSRRGIWMSDVCDGQMQAQKDFALRIPRVANLQIWKASRT